MFLIHSWMCYIYIWIRNKAILLTAIVIPTRRLHRNWQMPESHLDCFNWNFLWWLMKWNKSLRRCLDLVSDLSNALITLFFSCQKTLSCLLSWHNFNCAGEHLQMLLQILWLLLWMKLQKFTQQAIAETRASFERPVPVILSYLVVSQYKLS